MLRLSLFLLGFGLSIIGFIYIIAYLNYLTVGYTFIEYLNFIFQRPECILALIGLFIIILVIFTRGDKYDLCV